ncbi:precorrin-2 dehydrogenase/sirohydrochlorin ferrochelatase family protein [Paenibacillus radicis (ex Xue et al. 2023)]|uniref:precorrin-2 dehydrogenase n=1 Tax=Paenibacillus radicis (ex Xue et al. 2023) TaxID=2972489 RepID=A0ABT1Y8V0_9BACL|nr:bifunctional precorrin-2 dehydrogenase/sirohydrochlorin ferrochelatase [Paenibacillus radicis (ex Xue et al. 2023)]MCR8629617.1 bifunctional precorrin-2 dehydrogenase/sirohydrochlorin ferrochelatase [Paenibacillus radicis (ex Xue et al. 2023)]
MKERRNKSYYPLMLDIIGKPCVIIGGGVVAQRKAESLIEAGATITLISPACTEQLEEWALGGHVSIIKKHFQTGMTELREALLIFAATDQAEINEAVRLEAEALGKLVTVADDSKRSGFIVPAVVRRGKLVISVSTTGASPAVAKRVRQELEKTYGEEYEVYLELLQELRSLIKLKVKDTIERQAIFKSMLEWDLLGWIRSGSFISSSKQALMQRIEAEPTLAGIKKLDKWIRELTE